MAADAKPMAPSDGVQPPGIPEHMVVLLLEGAQQNLTKAEEAIRAHDPLIRDYRLKRSLAILRELNDRLNAADGGELVVNLSRLYDWWGREILEGGEQNDADRLKVVSTQMGEIRQAWEQVLFKGMGLTGNPEF